MSTPKDSAPVELDADGFVIQPAPAGDVSRPATPAGPVTPAVPTPAVTPPQEPAEVTAEPAGSTAPPVAAGPAPAAEPADDTTETSEVSEFDDPRRPLLRAMKMGSIALLVVTIVSLIGWGAVDDLAGIWGVLIGAVIGGGFVLLTVISVLATSKTDITTTAVVIMAGWLMKMIILIAVLWVLSGMTFYSTMALVVTIIASLIIVLIAETWGVVTSRVTYLS